MLFMRCVVHVRLKSSVSLRGDMTEAWS